LSLFTRPPPPQTQIPVTPQNGQEKRHGSGPYSKYPPSKQTPTNPKDQPSTQPGTCMEAFKPLPLNPYSSSLHVSGPLRAGYCPSWSPSRVPARGHNAATLAAW